jgi:hypothetical protein
MFAATSKSVPDIARGIKCCHRWFAVYFGTSSISDCPNGLKRFALEVLVAVLAITERNCSVAIIVPAMAITVSTGAIAVSAMTEAMSAGAIAVPAMPVVMSAGAIAVSAMTEAMSAGAIAVPAMPVAMSSGAIAVSSMTIVMSAGGMPMSAMTIVMSAGGMPMSAMTIAMSTMPVAVPTRREDITKINGETIIRLARVDRWTDAGERQQRSQSGERYFFHQCLLRTRGKLLLYQHYHYGLNPA